MVTYTNTKSNGIWTKKQYEPTHEKKQQNGMCTQRRLRSAWASAHLDQSLRCPHEESLGPKLPIECTAKTDQIGQTSRLIWVFAGCTCHFAGFDMHRLFDLCEVQRQELTKPSEDQAVTPAYCFSKVNRIMKWWIQRITNKAKFSLLPTFLTLSMLGKNFSRQHFE